MRYYSNSFKYNCGIKKCNKKIKYINKLQIFFKINKEKCEFGLSIPDVLIITFSYFY